MVMHFATGINENAVKVRAFLENGSAKVEQQKAKVELHDSPAFPRSARGKPMPHHPVHLEDNLAWDLPDVEI